MPPMHSLVNAEVGFHWNFSPLQSRSCVEGGTAEASVKYLLVLVMGQTRFWKNKLLNIMELELELTCIQ